MIKWIAKWLPEIPEAIIPEDDTDRTHESKIGASRDAQSVDLRHDRVQKDGDLSSTHLDLADEPLGPPRLIDPTIGSMQIGPYNITARFSLVLIFWAVVIFNVLLVFGVIIFALIKSGRL